MFAKRVSIAIVLCLGLSTALVFAQGRVQTHPVKQGAHAKSQHKVGSGREPILAVDSPNAYNGETVYGIVAGAPGVITYPVPNFTLTLTPVMANRKGKPVRVAIQPTQPVGSTAQQNVFQIAVQIPTAVGPHEYILSGSTTSGVVFTPVTIRTSDTMRKGKKGK